MALNTKIQIDDNHVVQESGTTLTFRGDATTKYNSHPTFTGATQLVDKKYVDDNIISGVTSGSTYDLLSPAAVVVGGITVGYSLTGKSSNCILQDMLYPELCGTLTAPSTVSTVLSCASDCLEIGTSVSMNVTSSFSRGSIDPQYCSTCADRSGAPVSYCFTGLGTNASYTCILDTAVRPTGVQTITSGANTWGSCTTYSAGVQPVSNKGINFSTPLASGTTTQKTDTITGILPWFYGVSDTCPTLDTALIATGIKEVATSDLTTCVQINFGDNTSKFLWFATPAVSTTKQGWYEGATNKGNIGQVPSDVWDAPVTVGVDSPQSCWTGCSYKMYTMNVPTSTTSSQTYCMTNNTQQ